MRGRMQTMRLTAAEIYLKGVGTGFGLGLAVAALFALMAWGLVA